MSNDRQTLLRNIWEYRQQQQAQFPRCAFCGDLVEELSLWLGPEEVHLEDGRHFHTDCYQVHLTQREQGAG